MANIADIIGVITGLICILGFICGIIKYIILDPLNKSINTLAITVAELKELADKMKDTTNSLDRRMLILETTLKDNGFLIGSK